MSEQYNRTGNTVRHNTIRGGLIALITLTALVLAGCNWSWTASPEDINNKEATPEQPTTPTPPPDDGTTTDPPDDSGTVTPPDDGSTTTPPDDGGTGTPPGDGGSNPPPDDGGTTTPPDDGGDGITSSLSGVAQKGPFQPGGTVTAVQLNRDGTRSDNRINDTIRGNGAYTFDELTWRGPTEIEARGSFFNEATGRFSGGQQITLRAFADSTQVSDANVNLLTDLTAARTAHLMGAGRDFADARTQAQGELGKVMDISSAPQALNLLNASATDHEKDSANLLLFSAALLSAGIDQPGIDMLAADFADDGMINGDGADTFSAIQKAARARRYPYLLEAARTYLGDQYGVTPPVNADGKPPRWAARDANKWFLYAGGADYGHGSNFVSAYMVEATNGLPKPATAGDAPCPDRSPGDNNCFTVPGNFPFTGALDPTGSFLYLVTPNNNDQNEINAYAVDASSGALSKIAGDDCYSPLYAGTCPTGRAVGGPQTIAMSPDGKFVYVANLRDPGYGETATLSAYRIDRDSGRLQPVGGGNCTNSSALPNCFLVPQSSIMVTIDPSGRFLYTGTVGADVVAVYAIDPDSGQLSPASGKGAVACQGPDPDIDYHNCYPVGGSPTSIAFSPGGEFIYIGDDSKDQIHAYRIDQATGALSPITTGAGGTCSGTPSQDNCFAALHPVTLTIGSGGRFLYGISMPPTFNDRAYIFRYGIDGATGALTPAAWEPCGRDSLLRNCVQTDIASFPLIGLSPDSAYVYATDMNAGTLSVFRIDGDNDRPTQVDGSPFDVGGNLWFMAIRP